MSGVGLGLVLLFNLASIAWLIRNVHGKTIDSVLIGLGVLCMVLMMAEKVMADEVAHETATVWSIQGEYLMLYGMFILQLIYNLLVAYDCSEHLRRRHNCEPAIVPKMNVFGTLCCRCSLNELQQNLWP